MELHFKEYEFCRRVIEYFVTITGTYGGGQYPTGFRFESTPGHGYLYVDKVRKARIPKQFHMASYEEDCDWAIPVFFFRHLFTQRTQECCIVTLASYHPEVLEQQGFVFLPGESSKRDQQAEHQQNLGKTYVRSAFGDWCYDVPEGYTYVHTAIASKHNADKDWIFNREDQSGGTFLIPKELKKPEGAFKQWLPETAIPYQRDEQYYTWDDFTKNTGLIRYI